MKEIDTRMKQQVCFFLFYLCFGVLHEAFHYGAARLLDPHVSVEPRIFVLQAIFGRFVHLPGLEGRHESIVRNTGWILSVLSAALVFAFSTTKACRTAGIITAFEALCTDLFGLGVVNAKGSLFFCGNFGIILLNPAWNDVDHGKTALELLERMIQVTMMRGAQSGGVVVWKKSVNNTRVGIRVRVVNGKRTDLSKKLGKQLKQTLCTTGHLEPSIRTLLGHTRFATTSKATFEGTHPHQWTPPEFRRIYPLDDHNLWQSHQPTPIVRKMENYVTHNGDFDFFKINGCLVDLEDIQKWLQLATGHPMPAPVDSGAIAGLIDLLRTAGCWGLSLRYALLVASPTAAAKLDVPYPSYRDYENLGMVFEAVIEEICRKHESSLSKPKTNHTFREAIINPICKQCKTSYNFGRGPFQRFFGGDDEEQGLLLQVVRLTVDAFFDNDLFQATKFFMKNAIGTFGLMVSCSEDAHRQICITARGQPMSVAFYPEKRIFCYGSEQAAVKACMHYHMPGGDLPKNDFANESKIANRTCRLDLDDLGGEAVLLDWGGHRTENDPMVSVTAHQESKTTDSQVGDRLTPLDNNELLRPLPPNSDDSIQDDLHDIPMALARIQDDWRVGGLNRVTAWNLGRSLKRRLQARVDGKIPIRSGTVDILVTGCEVSLWLAEQFASDLQMAFPGLCIKAVSSNKILGVYGQELAVPAIGYAMSSTFADLNDSIVLIVSHSGGTFAPLALSNLLQSATRDIFAMSSDWDTQIGKQLRKMFDDGADRFSSRIFSTDIGVRVAEPCSLSVAATHQLFTQIFELISSIVLSNQQFRHLSEAVITEKDLAILERCNQDNILALEQIVGKPHKDGHGTTDTERELREAGDLWANHILENVRAYILSILYIVGTVTAGYPLISGIAIVAGLKTGSSCFYLTRFIDSLIYLWLPQINVTLIRLWQGRNLRHRMVGRTVVIGDIPWVAQAADAFLSKIFARSYSIAGVNVLHGNPADHFVHRHTHRVVRGSLLVCGRPDGRLAALTSSECAVNLSVNQASSIQSLGGTCESITIGHNPASLVLTKIDIFLGTFRPKFLCERVLGIIEEENPRKQKILSSRQQDEEGKQSGPSRRNDSGFVREGVGLQDGPRDLDATTTMTKSLNRRSSSSQSLTEFYLDTQEKVSSQRSITTDDKSPPTMTRNLNRRRSSQPLKDYYLGMQEKVSRQRNITTGDTASPPPPRTTESLERHRSSQSLKGFYLGMQEKVSSQRNIFTDDEAPLSKEDLVLESMINEGKAANLLRKTFNDMDKDSSGTIYMEEFIGAHQIAKPGMSRETLEAIFREADTDNDGALAYNEFVELLQMPDVQVIRKLQQSVHRDDRGLLQVNPSTEDYFGEELQSSAPSAITTFAQSQSQHFAMELYESRVASLQRFVALTVMFHQMGKQVQDFFPRISFGYLGYQMDRTHSILRIATTASPVSGDAIRERMETLRLRSKFQNAARIIGNAWLRHQDRHLTIFKAERLRTSLSQKSRSRKLVTSKKTVSTNEICV